MRKERRRSRRLPIGKAVLLTVESVAHSAYMIDISQHGLRVMASFPLRPGQVVEFKSHGDSNYSVRCLVMWTGEAGSDHEGEAGLDFLNLEQAPQQEA
jgi:hypothetical protein